MRRWYLPITVVGLGGLGILLGTEKGRSTVRRVADFFEDAPQHFADWNEAAEMELDRIQEAIDSVAAMLKQA